MTESKTTELRWIFRPSQDRPGAVRALSGSSIYAAGPVGPDGETDVVLRDGTRVRAASVEIVAE